MCWFRRYGYAIFIIYETTIKQINCEVVGSKKIKTNSRKIKINFGKVSFLIMKSVKIDA